MTEENTGTTETGNTGDGSDGATSTDTHFLSEDMQKNESLTGFKTGDELGQAYLDMAGKQAVVPDADKYEFAIEGMTPEDVGKISEGLGTVANELGLSQEQGAGVLSHIAGRDAQLAQAADKSLQDTREATQNALKQEWGSKYEENLKTVERARNTFIDEATRTFLNDNGLADHPGMVKVFYEIGSKMSEATLHLGNNSPGDGRKTDTAGKPMIAFPSMDK